MKPKTIPMNFDVRTDGTSIWCDAGPRDVHIRGLYLQICDIQNDTWGLLTVYTSISGYELYTDNGYLDALNNFLGDTMNMPAVDYSEQGM